LCGTFEYVWKGTLKKMNGKKKIKEDRKVLSVGDTRTVHQRRSEGTAKIDLSLILKPM